MKEHLRDHVIKFTNIDEKQLSEILTYFKVVDVTKRENLLIEGNTCKNNYFVNKGCLRLFFINGKGIEQTIQFALENWWLADYTSFSAQIPSDFYIQAVENSNLLTLDFKAQEALLHDFPQMERYFRLVHQRAHAASQFRIKTLYGFSREELYHMFNKRYPEFVQRIPQYLLASFLGFTPEYLSEIRNRKLS